jgi:NitT/TauT family transport system substrate-binding protein
MNKSDTLHATIVLLIAILLSSCSPAPRSAEPPTVLPVAQPTDTLLPTESAEPIHLKIGYQPLISHAPFFIAQEEGLFAEQGLEVELIQFNRASEMMPALLQGALDVVAGSINVLTFNAIAQGGQAKYVASKGYIDPVGCSADGWVARVELINSGRLANMADLRGLKVTKNTGSVWDYTMDMLLAQGGLTEEDIEITDISQQANRLEALGTGAVDIASLAEPWITRAKLTGYGDVFLPLQKLIPDFDLGTLVYGPNLLDKNPMAGKKFMVAYLQAIQIYNQGKTDRNVESLAKYTQLTSDEIKQSCWSSFRADGHINLQGLLDFQDWAVKKGFVDIALTSEQLWDSQFIDYANSVLR